MSAATASYGMYQHNKAYDALEVHDIAGVESTGHKDFSSAFDLFSKFPVFLTNNITGKEDFQIFDRIVDLAHG